MRAVGPVERAEPEHLVAVEGAQPGRFLEILAFHIKHYDRARKGQQVRNDKAHALTGPGRGHHHHVRNIACRDKGGLRPGFAQLAADKACPRGLQHAVDLELSLCLPMRGAVIIAVLRPGPAEGQHRQSDSPKSDRAKGDLKRLGMGRPQACACGPDRKHIKVGHTCLESQSEIETGHNGAEGRPAQRAHGHGSPERQTGTHQKLISSSRSRDRSRPVSKPLPRCNSRLVSWAIALALSCCKAAARSVNI